MSQQETIGGLVSAADRYLARFAGPGIPDVRAGIGRAGGFNPQTAQSQPAVAHLSLALKALAADGEEQLADTISEASPLLQWVAYDAYPRAEIGAAFAEGHAFASLIGEAAPFAADDFELGLFIIAPRIFYRDRHHAAPELYAPLTGPHGWRFAPGAALDWRPAHQPVWNPPWQHHATKVGDLPFLCLFGWTRDVNLPAKVIPSNDWESIEAP